jgi:GTP pyrophosphokinase
MRRSSPKTAVDPTLDTLPVGIADPAFVAAQAFVARHLDHAARQRAQTVAGVLAGWEQAPELVLAGLFVDLPPALVRDAPIPQAAAVADLVARAGSYRRNASGSHALIHAPFTDLPALLLLLAADHQRLLAAKADPAMAPAILDDLFTITLPLLKRLGMWDEKRLFEDELLALRDPTAYSETAARFRTLLADGGARLEQVRRQIERACRQALEEHAGMVTVQIVQPTISGARRRIDNLRALRRAHQVTIFDLAIFEVHVETVADCYTALAAVHSAGWPVGDRFSDFIAAPKFNGYSALMTTVALPVDDGHHENCQVRVLTAEMAAIAGRGALYSPCATAYRRELPRNPANGNDVAALLVSCEGKALLAIAGSWGGESGSKKGTPIDVYTMTGERRTLPLGATALDFAFSLHTEIGLYTAGAWVNSTAVPLNYRLDPGDVVRFTTSTQLQVRESWLDPNMTVTAKARQKIRHALYQDKAVRGRQLVRQALARQRPDVVVEDSAQLNEMARPLADALNLRNTEELFQRVESKDADPDYRASVIAGRIGRSLARAIPPTPETSPPVVLEHWEPVLDSALLHEDNVAPRHPFRLCRRCAPRYPDQIAARMTSASTLAVHRVDCPHLAAVPAPLPLTWQCVADPITVQLSVSARDRNSLVHDLTGVISRTSCYLSGVHTELNERSNDARILLDVRAPTAHDLLRLRARLCRVRSVRSVELAQETPAPLVAALQEIEQERRLRRRTPRVTASPPAIHFNPYNVSKPAARSMFFGRERDREFLRNTLVTPPRGQAMILQGPWRTGKTSLALNFLPDVSGDTALVRVNLLTLKSANEAQILAAIADQICLELAQAGRPEPPRWDDQHHDPETAFTAFVRAALVPDLRRLILVLDEFGAAVDSYKDGHLDERFFDYWKTLLEREARLSLLFVIPSNTRQRLADQRLWSHLSYASSHNIGFLDAQAARGLLKRPLDDLWVRIRPDAIEEALMLTGRSPYHLVLLGQQIVQRLSDLPRPRTVDASDVRAAAERLLENETAFYYLFDERSPLERRVLAELAAQASRSAHYTAQPARLAAAQALDEAEARAALEQLCLLHIVYRNGQAYGITIGLFRLWLLQHAGQRDG